MNVGNKYKYLLDDDNEKIYLNVAGKNFATFDLMFLQKKYKKQEFIINQVDYDFINGYDLFLRETYSLHKNTINKYHSRFRTILLKALAEGHLFKQPYANFKLNSVKTDREFLSQIELNKIIEFDLSHNSSLDKVKDLFIFSVYIVNFKYNFSFPIIISNRK